MNLDGDDKFLLAWGVIGTTIALGFFAMLFTFIHAQQRWELGRDMYYAAHCKEVNKYVSKDSVQSVIQYQCASK